MTKPDPNSMEWRLKNAIEEIEWLLMRAPPRIDDVLYICAALRSNYGEGCFASPTERGPLPPAQREGN